MALLELSDRLTCEEYLKSSGRFDSDVASVNLLESALASAREWITSEARDFEASETLPQSLHQAATELASAIFDDRRGVNTIEAVGITNAVPIIDPYYRIRKKIAPYARVRIGFAATTSDAPIAIRPDGVAI